MQLQLWQWSFAFLAAFFIGLSKTGIAGLSTFAVGVFALVLPARESVGLVLPILLAGDLVAVTTYRRHALWAYVGRLLPWGVVGIFLGYFALSRIDDQQVQLVIGAVLLVLSLLQFWRMRALGDAEVELANIPHVALIIAVIGIVAGFTTMVANAAGPIIVLCLLAMRLPKFQFIGTSAWCFFALNLIKVPFSYQLGLINGASLPLDARIIPFTFLGALCGRVLLVHIDQKLFERLALGLTFLAALRLLF